MKKQKTAIDHFFDILLILAPFTLLLPVDIYTKTMCMFFVFYLPYLVYAIRKEDQKKLARRVKKVRQTVKKAEAVLV